MTELARLRKALQRIADYDAKRAAGYIDEWQEAAAFGACQEIARGALDPAYVTAQRAAIATERRVRRERKRELIRGIGANRRWFYRGSHFDGVWVRVLPRAPDRPENQEHCVVAKVIEVVGRPSFCARRVGDEFEVNTVNLWPEERAVEFLSMAPPSPPAPPDPRLVRLGEAIGETMRRLASAGVRVPRTDDGLEFLRREFNKALGGREEVTMTFADDGNVHVHAMGVSRAL